MKHSQTEIDLVIDYR